MYTSCWQGTLTQDDAGCHNNAIDIVSLLQGSPKEGRCLHRQRETLHNHCQRLLVGVVCQAAEHIDLLLDREPRRVTSSIMKENMKEH